MGSYQESLRVVERAIALSNTGDIGGLVALANPDIEVVGRDGKLHGAAAIDYLTQFMNAMNRVFEVTITVDRFIDAGQGTVIAFVTHRREGRDPGVGYLTNWGAQVYRVEDGLITFYEGYQDRIKVLSDLGLPKTS